MKIEYVAFDGKRFESENQCKEYEAADFFILDNNGNILTFTKEVFEGLCVYIYFANKEAIKSFLQTLETWYEDSDYEMGIFCHPSDFSKPGLYMYCVAGHFFPYIEDCFKTAKILNEKYTTKMKGKFKNEN